MSILDEFEEALRVALDEGDTSSTVLAAFEQMFRYIHEEDPCYCKTRILTKPCRHCRLLTAAKDALKSTYGTCRVCGCTDDDCSQCIEAQGGPCAWEDDSHTICTRCANETEKTKCQK